MTTPYLQTEDIAWAVYDTLVNNLPAQLEEVEARRNAQGRMTVALPVPAIIDLGFDVEAMDAPPDMFPRVSFMAAPRAPQTVDADQRLAMATHGILLEWMIIANSRMEATVRAWRYGEAILQTLLAMPAFAGFEPETMLPTVQEGQPLEFDGQSSMAPTNRRYMAAGQVTLPVRGKYVL